MKSNSQACLEKTTETIKVDDNQSVFTQSPEKIHKKLLLAKYNRKSQVKLGMKANWHERDQKYRVYKLNMTKNYFSQQYKEMQGPGRTKADTDYLYRGGGHRWRQSGQE